MQETTLSQTNEPNLCILHALTPVFRTWPASVLLFCCFAYVCLFRAYGFGTFPVDWEDFDILTGQKKLLGMLTPSVLEPRDGKGKD